MRNKKIILSALLMIGIGLLEIYAQTVKDIEGKEYKIVTIGTQTWMAENLTTTKLNDGTTIPNVIDAKSWQANSTPGYCWYDNDAATYKVTYGALYNWYIVKTGKLCPTGWHVPSKAEWRTLIAYVEGKSSYTAAETEKL